MFDNQVDVHHTGLHGKGMYDKVLQCYHWDSQRFWEFCVKYDLITYFILFIINLDNKLCIQI